MVSHPTGCSQYGITVPARAPCHFYSTHISHVYCGPSTHSPCLSHYNPMQIDAIAPTHSRLVLLIRRTQPPTRSPQASLIHHPGVRSTDTIVTETLHKPIPADLPRAPRVLLLRMRSMLNSAKPHADDGLTTSFAPRRCNWRNRHQAGTVRLELIQ